MSESPSAYRTVVVGTDGSESSLRAVSRAGAIAGATGVQGSPVPAAVTRRSTCDVLVVHTTG